MKKSSTPGRLVNFDAAQRKTFHSALCHLLQTEFTGHFGPAVTDLFAERIEDLFDRFHPHRDRMKIGQVLWTGVAVDDPPARNKRIENTRLVPVVLDLVTLRDIEEATLPAQRLATRSAKIVRLFQQAHQQAAVLGNADIALLLHTSLSVVSNTVLAHERLTGQLLPRRGTLHDMGPSVTHKGVICYKHFIERKTTSQIAQETSHSPEEVEYYIGCFQRVKLCQEAGMTTVEEIAQVTGHSKGLVQQYLNLIARLHLSPSDKSHQLPSHRKLNAKTVKAK